MRRSCAFVQAILAATVTAMSSAYAKAQPFIWAVAAGALFMSVIDASATAAPLVSWRIIHGNVVAFNFSNGVPADAFLWTTINGNATIDMGAGSVQFSVIGLTVAETNAIGTTVGPFGNVTQVFGTIGCPAGQNQFVFASTQAVPLSPQGDASSGILPISIPLQCTPSNIAFFVTIFPNSDYIGFGASRFTH